jgi:hypothetical protein
MEVKLKKVAEVIAIPYNQDETAKVEGSLYKCTLKFREYVQKKGSGNKLFLKEKKIKFILFSVLHNFSKVEEEELKELIEFYSLEDIKNSKTLLETDIQRFSKFFNNGYFQTISVYDNKYNKRHLVFKDGKLL